MKVQAKFETCPECDSLDVSERFLREEDGKQVFEVVCRECGADWEDWEDNEIS